MKRTLFLFLSIALAASLTCCKSKTKTPADDNSGDQATTTLVNDGDGSSEGSDIAEYEESEAMDKETKFVIATSMGDMTVKLYDETPLHKKNFIKLARGRFYDGIRFHRIINGFMIQVGDPLTKDSTQVAKWGTGGPGYTIPAEIVSGFTHKKGALAAARRGDSANPAKESSGSQFYIVHDMNGCRHLDGEYTIFGEVVSGFEIIDKIASVSVDMHDKPIKEVKIISVREVK